MATKTLKKSKDARVTKAMTRAAYNFKAKGTIGIGDVVRLASSALQTTDPRPETFAGVPIKKTKVVSIFKENPNLVRLEHRLGGYWTWEMADLRVVKRAQHGRKS